MKKTRCILTVDVGTSNLKSIVYDLGGVPISKSCREYHPTFTASSGVEQDPRTWQNALISTLKETSQYLNQGRADILAISVTSQRASIIPVDRECQPLFRATMWQDKRSMEQCSRLSELIGASKIYQGTGLRADPYFSLPKMLWLREKHPEIYSRSYRLIGVQDYVIYLLTDNFVTDWTQASRTMLMDIRNFEWDLDLLRTVDIHSSLLPDLLPPGSIAGKLRKHMASSTGLPEGIPVIMAGGDQQCAALGLNALSPGYVGANTGTGSFVIALSEKPVFDEKERTLCSAAPLPGKWIVEAGILTTGSIYRWFREQFYAPLSVKENPYEVLDREVKETPIGSNGVMVLPYFEGSATPHWNPMAKGLVFNLTLGTKRGDIARAVLEGICLEISDNVSLIEDIAENITAVTVGGGLTKSSLFNQIQADAFNKPVVKYQHGEASSLGAAISCAVTLGIHDTYHEAFQEMSTGNPITSSPIAENVSKYRDLIKRKNRLHMALEEKNVYGLFQDGF